MKHLTLFQLTAAITEVLDDIIDADINGEDTQPLKAGEAIDGVDLERTEHIRIRVS